MEVAQIRAEDGTFQKCITKKQMSLQKLKHIYEILKEELIGGILRPKSVRRPLVMGLIYGPRANEQFNIAF